MIFVDRKRFFDLYRTEFGSVSQQQVNGLTFLLDSLERDPYITDRRHAAYMFATTKHETAGTFQPIHEYGSKSYFIKRYGGQTAKGKELGNDTPEEGYYYSGMGFPQTTGETNYEKAEDAIRKEYPDVVADFERRTGKTFDLTVGDQPNDQDDPRNMLDPAIAYVTMSHGMRTGMFTRKKLSDFIHGKECDYKNARKIINGLDKAALIAGYAEKFETVFNNSKSDTPSAAAPIASSDQGGFDQSNTSADPSNQGQPPSKEIKAEIAPDGSVRVESSETKPAEKERVAVVKGDKKTWGAAITAKVTAILSSNVLFQWVWAQIDKISGLPIPTFIWGVVSITIAIATLLWLAHEVIDVFKSNNYSKEIDNLLVKENSTPDNLVQLIPADQIELYRLRGFKIITRGQTIPEQQKAV